MVSTLTGGVAGLLKKNKIDLIEGTGALVGAGKVSVNGSDEITAKTIVLATGSVKRSIPGAQFGGRVIGTEEAWALDELPASLAVVGAGASGSEIASAYARLGSEVLLFEALERVLPTEDADISKVAERGSRSRGSPCIRTRSSRRSSRGPTASRSPTAGPGRAKWSGW